MPTPTKKHKILIIEDEKDLIMIYKTKLEQKGYEVKSTEDITKGLDMVRREKPDLVLLDLVFPDPKSPIFQLSSEPGYFFLEGLRHFAKLHQVPVIVLTNLVSREDKERSFKLGAKDYIVKLEKTPEQVYQRVEKFFRLKK